jgi:hypothetical protein
MAIGENLFYRTRDLLDDLILGLFSLLFSSSLFLSFFLSVIVSSQKNGSICINYYFSSMNLQS